MYTIRLMEMDIPNVIAYTSWSTTGLTYATFLIYETFDFSGVNKKATLTSRSVSLYGANVWGTYKESTKSSYGLPFKLSNNRIASIYGIEELIRDTWTTVYHAAITIFDYGYDSNGKFFVTEVVTHQDLPFYDKMQFITPLGEDAFIVSGQGGAFGFQVTTDNKIIMSDLLPDIKVISNPTRVGKTDTCFTNYGSSYGYLIGYDRNANVVTCSQTTYAPTMTRIPYGEEELLFANTYSPNIVLHKAKFE